MSEIDRNTNLDDVQQVLEYVAGKPVKDSYKANIVDFYAHYCDFNGLELKKPRYCRNHRIPFVPTKEELSLIISHASPKYALIYSIMKDTGLRPVEVSHLTVNDMDLEKGILAIQTAKHGQPRTVKLKGQTLGMLKMYVAKHNGNPLFPSSNLISNTYGRLRASLVEKLQRPELKKIRLYDFRHYYATNLYHDTRDLLLVKERLGHRNIQNTLVYTHLLSLEEDGSFFSATARTVQEAAKLIEQGFDLVTDVDGVKLFRKRK